MPVDYEAIKKHNLRWYGEGVSEWAPPVLSNRYDGHTHFIFEVLQNAEDALKKRGEWEGKRSVHFSLDSEALTVSHFGKPFDEDDVIGVCGIAKSTKEFTDIGRFGIGFKSVYTFTDIPEIHSGEEHFSIDTYVLPRAAKKISLAPEETRIYIPFKAGEPSAKDNVIEGLQCLGPRTLLFLREIEEIAWSVDGESAGNYRRLNAENLLDFARKVQIIGQSNAETEVTEEWLVFSREVFHEGKSAGYVEIAFGLDSNNEGTSVQSVDDSKLVVFFPTVLSTYLGFLVQGPYRTTPSRDNVPQRDPWNQHLINETAILLTNSLESLKHLGLLSVSALRCLPLDSSFFAEDSRFASLFQSVRENLKTKDLLPAYSGGHIAAQNAKLAGSRELRELVIPEQLAQLFASTDALFWLSDAITPDRTKDLHDYLTDELDINEVTPVSLVRRLTPDFLVSQPDEWIESLYQFLNGQRGWEIRRLLPTIPLVRLDDGSHTCAIVDGKPQAYLPGDSQTGFPTVRRSVCQSDDAQEFLRRLELRAPDLVDDVIENLLPKYDQEVIDIPDRDYQSDIERIVAALATDSASQRDNLVSHLRKAKFVFAMDAGSGDRQLVKPAAAYMATRRLTSLFQDVTGVLFVDNSKLGL